MPFVFEDKIKVSVILPSLNVKRYIEECLESVLNQTLKEIEVICVDAGSKDGTLEILREYAIKDNRIKIIESTIKSYGYQVNLGITEALGEYIAIVETDDFIDRKMYEELYNYAKKVKADIVKAPYIDYNDDRNKRECYFANKLNEVLPKGRCFSLKEYGHLLAFHASVWSGIYRKEYLLKKEIFFLEASGAGYVDVGFRLDSLINTDRIAWFNKSFYYYRRSNDDSSTNRFSLKTMCTRWKEAHEKLASIQTDYDEFYGKYAILDEYLNTIAYMGHMEVSEEELQIMIDNCNYIDKRIIEGSPVLSERIKRKILSFKSDPFEYYLKKKQTLKVYSVFKKIGNRFFPHGSVVREMIKRALFLQNV